MIIHIKEHLEDWAFQYNLEIYQIKQVSPTRWTFSAIDAGASGGWGGDLAYENGVITNLGTGESWTWPEKKSTSAG